MSKHCTEQVTIEVFPSLPDPRPFDVFCIECNLNERVASLVEAGRIYDEHDGGPHEIECYNHVSDQMIPRTVLMDAKDEATNDISRLMVEVAGCDQIRQDSKKEIS